MRYYEITKQEKIYVEEEYNQGIENTVARIAKTTNGQ